MKNVLHNYVDDDCLIILRHLRDAMKPGYSKLLVCNFVLPDKAVPIHVSGLNNLMNFLVGGCQRSEDEWEILLSRTGLTVTKFWIRDTGESIVEAEVSSTSHMG